MVKSVSKFQFINRVDIKNCIDPNWEYYSKISGLDDLYIIKM